MKTRSRLMQHTLRILLILVLLLGIYIAWVTYKYEIVVRGIVGGALIYLLSYYLRTSKTDLPFDLVVSESKIYKNIIFTFIGPIIAFWAFAGVLDMLLFFTERLYEFIK